MPLVLSGTDGVSGVDGTASNPAIEGTDSNTGIFYPAADTVAIGTGGTEALRVNSSQNVGIGTSSPTAASSRRGLVLRGNANGAELIVQSTSATDGTSDGFSLTTVGTDAYLFNRLNGFTAFATNNTERMRLDASGNLGIGTSSPAVTLHAANTSGGGVSGANPSGEVSRIQQTPSFGSGGFVVQRLFLNKTSTANDGVTQSFEGLAVGGDRYALANIGGYIDNAGSGNSVSGYFAILTKPTNASITERARITSGGNVLLNTTTVGAGIGGSPILTMNGLTSQDVATIKCNSTAAGNLPLAVWHTATSGNNNFVYFYTEGTPSTRGSIDYNRAAGQVRYNITSDATLKNIIGDSDGQKSVEILNSTRIREFAWKDDEQQKPQIGVIAQELYETYKGAVSVGGDIEKTDAEGNVTTEYRPWGVDKTAFTFHLIAGWQAHEKMIQELKAEIAALKGNA